MVRPEHTRMQTRRGRPTRVTTENLNFTRRCLKNLLNGAPTTAEVTQVGASQWESVARRVSLPSHCATTTDRITLGRFSGSPHSGANTTTKTAAPADTLYRSSQITSSRIHYFFSAEKTTNGKLRPAGHRWWMGGLAASKTRRVMLCCWTTDVAFMAITGVTDRQKAVNIN